MHDYYAVLQVHPSASSDVINKAYRVLIAKHHPDVGGYAEMARSIIEAFEVLSDPSKRAGYDRQLFDTLYYWNQRVGMEPASKPTSRAPEDSQPQVAIRHGRLVVCPEGGKRNPLGRKRCQWCHKYYVEQV